MKRLNLLLMLFTTISLSTFAQIGYQVSLLNNATGEPRANEQVTVTVKITDSKGTIVCEETKNETSNDFGVVSMTIGNSETFANADWTKLPFFIETSVDGRSIGKSQLLSIPVAEYAKHTGSLSKELLCKKEWSYIDPDDGEIIEKYLFRSDGSVIWTYCDWSEYERRYKTQTGIYEMVGNTISIFIDNDYYQGRYCLYNSIRNILLIIRRDYIWPYKQL